MTSVRRAKLDPLRRQRIQSRVKKIDDWPHCNLGYLSDPCSFGAKRERKRSFREKCITKCNLGTRSKITTRGSSVIPSRADGEGPRKRSNRYRATEGVSGRARAMLFVAALIIVRSLAVCAARDDSAHPIS